MGLTRDVAPPSLRLATCTRVLRSDLRKRAVECVLVLFELSARPFRTQTTEGVGGAWEKGLWRKRHGGLEG